MRRVWLIVQLDRSDTAASVRQGQQWFAHAELIGCALVPAAGAKRHRQVENLDTSHTSYGVF